ncbi:porin family protein [Vibrio hippocampi]|uniref:Outer membrane protein beta-barrel domain-containing protein n=1 Tax=Vibrio hippocampi TaxID=654686 RepID=A0ABN8DNM2_9VIBR|nr:porin family protein [Vibrio hippocampi]CAH0529508.1 hypothetical protein VHP8226_03262 [Vibrio hippocampi]
MKKSFFIALLSLFSASTLAQDSFFPIWGEEAYERGYTLPKPYGFSISYMDMSNPIIVDSIDINGGFAGGLVDDIEAKHADFTGSNITLRGDVWVFPFMNLYGILGYTEAKSTAKIDSITVAGNKVELDNANFTLDMKGTTYGAGVTFAGGVDNWFSILDINYTYTSLNVIDGDIKTLVAAPRFGHRWTYNDGNELRVYIGGMYQDVQQFLSGDVNALGFNGGPLTDGTRFEVSQRTEDKWNFITGAQFQFRHEWEILTEFGFGERSSAFISLGKRF